MIKIIIGVIVVAAVVIGGFMILDPNVSTGIVTTSESDSTSTFSASIDGEIENSGTYTLSEGATLGDLIDKAGGVTSNADERCYYESIEIVSGQTYYIAGLYNANDVCNQEEITKVNINSDDAETIMTVGFSSSVASNIVSYRESDGPFYTLEQLTEVYGIGSATYKKYRDYVYLHELDA